MDTFVINNISAGEFLNKQYLIGDRYYDNHLAPYWSLLKEYSDSLERNSIFNSSEDMDTFYGLLDACYGFLMKDLRFMLSNSYKTMQARESNLTTNRASLTEIINTLLQERILLEPNTKLFLEDLYDLLYRNRNISISNHFYILSKPIKDYKIGTKGIEIRLDSENKSYLKNDRITSKPAYDLSRLLDLLGIRGTLDVLHILIGIWINTYLYTYKVMLDSLVKPTLTWKNIGMGTAFISNRGNSSNGSDSTTGGSTLPVTPGSGGTVPGTGTGGTGTPGSTPGTGTGTGSGTPTVRPNVSVIIPFAATPMR
jgi:jasmonate inducible protein isolog